ncbi:hypothetical protein B5F76_03775 [Desulfovibrio sp. An276]|uniref:o-succinylbenzoate synthase n=1 Tax=Desulfovibrio sp. An276 TaxID=1965618 RepID=UPI000B36F3B7|nr:o-succinylbenzoate synthase [Desulfovibrio sp. An276]OUO54229.1 hypothetical protein B5F76_03775 [Desulfovibrio sp. An276]
MAWQYAIKRRTLHFHEPAGTSRGVYTTRTVWYVVLFDMAAGVFGVGECAPLPALSPELPTAEEGNLNALEARLEEATRAFVAGACTSAAIPEETPSSIRMALETAHLHVKTKSVRFFKTPFARGEEDIAINGLVWMGDKKTMVRRMEEKLEQGFSCIKCKIGGIDFESELEMLGILRSLAPDPQKVELRLDANGAFAPEEADKKLEALAKFSPHSIEQPIRKGQWQEMARLCKTSPIPIALDEELIGVPRRERLKLVEEIAPAYFVLKPSLHGGFKGCEQWIDLAIMSGSGFWVTSALESNIGLNAIAQWCGTLDCPLPQGLGTGKLFSDNCEIMPVHIVGTALHCDPAAHEPDLLAWLGLGMLSFLGS